MEFWTGLFRAAASNLGGGRSYDTVPHVVWAFEPGWPPVRGLPVKFASHFGVILALASWSGAGFAQKLVDPNSVAPEFRAAAEKRRAEQIKLIECTKKANQAKVLPRDRAAFVSDCLEK
jgi:hypothetical protein